MLINIDEIATGALINALAVAGRRLSLGLGKLPRRRRAKDIAVARWFETYQLTGTVPDLSPALTDQLKAILSGDEIQAALQELLAARLTNAPETDATRARDLLRQTIASAAPAAAGSLAGYYDDEICALVARLEADDATVLAQIRAEAFSTRTIAVLNAIERHTAALAARPDHRTEARFLASYRHHVIDKHGKLEPPDFERRRRVPIADIYVPTVITEDIQSERTVVPLPDQPTRTVLDLPDQLDRAVLLGDPGGGKTTASNVLMHHFASDPAGRIPLLVTLRDYAAQDPPERSIVGHIEHTLETLYQCSAPPGLIDLLLLTARAIVIFDGLDELLDTSRRADVTTRVEQFCLEYPLAPLLVTSRMVGYDQARLDDRHFTCYRLGGFTDAEVAEYARKWFALDEGASAGDAEAFLAETRSIPDLRSNPLLMSLICILYRGEGSLPRDRAGVYERCANLLFRRWDARRRIHQDLRAGHLLEPALRHLAWWLFTGEETQTAVTEHQLVAATTEFLHGRGFESKDDARDAAREFVEFARGRMWVFSDAGTTATGDRLWAFTHRTFLEYFAAAQLAYDSDTPERLARTLAPHVARGEWEIVGELAVQIKDGTSNAGARRVYEALLGERRRRSPESRSGVLQFLARTLRSVDPSPHTTRALTKEVLDFLFSGDPDSSTYGLPLAWLLGSCGACQTIIDEEISGAIAAMTASGEPTKHVDGLRLAISLDVPLRGSWHGLGPDLLRGDRLRRFWEDRTAENVGTYTDAIIAAAAHHSNIRNVALARHLITIDQALKMRGGLLPLLQIQPMNIFGLIWASHLLGKFYILAHGWDGYTDPDIRADAISDFLIIGNHLINYPQLPWVTERADTWSSYPWSGPAAEDAAQAHVDPIAYLGAAGTVLISAESGDSAPSRVLDGDPSRLGPFSDLYPYLERRWSADPNLPLPDLPVPEEFKRTFRGWAEGRVNFTSPDRGGQSG